MAATLRSLRGRAARHLFPAGDSRYGLIFLTSRILAAGLSAVVSILAFIVAGAARVGTYASVIAIVAFAGGMAGSWISQTVLRYPGFSSWSTVRFIRHSTWRGVVFSIGAILLGAVICAFLPAAAAPGRAFTFLLVAVMSASFAALTVDQAKAMADNRGFAVMWTELGRSMSLVLPPLLVVLWWPGDTSDFLLRCLALGTVVQLVASLASRAIRARNRHRSAGPDSNVPTGRSTFAYGAPLGVWIGMSAIYQNADRVMLALLVSASAAGQYSLVYDISSRGLLLPVTALSGAATAAVLKLFNSGDADSATAMNRRLARTQVALMVAMGVVVLVGAFVATHYVAWFDLGYAATAVVVYAGAAIWTLADTVQREQLGTGKSLPLLKWLSIVALANIVINFAAIPLLGALGAGLATLVCATAYVVVVKRMARSRTATRAG